jgi:hypothetical protein
MKKILFLGVMLLIFCSCSTLKVQVSAADQDQLKKIADKLDVFEKMAFDYRKALIPLTNAKIITKRDDLINQYAIASKKAVASGNRDSSTAGLAQGSFKAGYIKAIDEILTDFNKANIEMVNKRYHAAVDIYLLLPQKLQKVASNLALDDALEEQQKEPFITDITQKLSTANTVFHGGRANLLGDKMVAYITMKKNDTLWKSTYNKTVSTTFFGNADIAVVLNEMPDSYNNNYSIKGVRVDAAKLIQSTFDVMTQVVNIAASMTGITLPNTSGDTASFQPEEFDQIKNLPANTVELQNRKEVLQAAKKQLLLKILGENLAHKKGDDLKKSVEAINTFWDVYKPNIAPAPPQPQTTEQ